MIDYPKDYDYINEHQAELNELTAKIENGETLKGVRIA